MGCGASHSVGPYRPDGSAWTYDTFISYRNGCEACKGFCRELKEELELSSLSASSQTPNTPRLKCFFDAGVLSLGDDWESKIGSGISGAKSMVIVVCEGYGCTEWTTKEAERAENLGIPIWPIWHCGAYPPTGCSSQVASILSARQRAPREAPFSKPFEVQVPPEMKWTRMGQLPGPGYASHLVRQAYIGANLCDREQDMAVKGVQVPFGQAPYGQAAPYG